MSFIEGLTSTTIHSSNASSLDLNHYARKVHKTILLPVWDIFKFFENSKKFSFMAHCKDRSLDIRNWHWITNLQFLPYCVSYEFPILHFYCAMIHTEIKLKKTNKYFLRFFNVIDCRYLQCLLYDTHSFHLYISFVHIYCLLWFWWILYCR